MQEPEQKGRSELTALFIQMPENYRNDVCLQPIETGCHNPDLQGGQPVFILRQWLRLRRGHLLAVPLRQRSCALVWR